MENPFRVSIDYIADKVAPVSEFIDNISMTHEERKKREEAKLITEEDDLYVLDHPRNKITDMFAEIFPDKNFTDENLLQKLIEAKITRGELLDVIYASTVALRGSVQRKPFDRLKEGLKLKIASIQ